MRIRRFVGAVRRFTGRVIRRFRQDRCQRVAGALSFTTIMAIVPLTAVMLSVLSLFPVFNTWMGLIQEFVYANFVPAAGDVVRKYLTQFAAQAGRLTAVGLVFLFVTSIMLMATIEEVFNDIWRIEITRRWVHRFLAYWAFLTLGPILLAASLVLATKLFTALPFAAATETTLLNELFDVALPVMLKFAAALLLYMVVPNTSVDWRHALAGAGFAVVMLEIARVLFAESMRFFISSYKIVYGAVAALPIFLLWIYISWTIVLVGAIVTAVLGERAAARS